MGQREADLPWGQGAAAAQARGGLALWQFEAAHLSRVREAGWLMLTPGWGGWRWGHGNFWEGPWGAFFSWVDASTGTA